VPRLSVVFLRTALCMLLAASGLGALLLSAKGGWPPALPPALHRIHLELATLGWFGNLTLGTAYWVLPKHAQGRERGAPLPPVAAYVLLNLGVVSAAAGWTLPGRALELVAAVAFAGNALPRVKGFGSRG
jgi:hypothetical protein